MGKKDIRQNEGSHDRLSFTKPQEVREEEDQQFINKHLKGAASRGPMVGFINRLYEEAHSEEGMSLACQRFITKLLQDAARFADDPDDREARNNPLARVLKLSGKQDRKWFEFSTAKMLHRYVCEKEGKRGALAYAMKELYRRYPDLVNIYSESRLRGIYKKFDVKLLDETYADELLEDYFTQICNK